MRLMANWKLRTVGGSCLLTLLSTLSQAGQAGAQVPAGPPALPERIITKSSSFDLPILMKDQQTKQKLREVCLYVKTPGAGWVKHETALPTATKFSYKAPQDGEYWFNLVTIDNTGRATPADVTSAPPGLRVVVDSKPPVIDVQVTADKDCTLRCTMQDAHPNPKSLKAVAHSPAGDVALEAVKDQDGVFHVRPEHMSCTIHVTASDQAGNTAMREVNVKEVLAATHPAPATPAALPMSVGNTGASRPLTVETPVVAQTPPTPSVVTPAAAVEKTATPPAAPNVSAPPATPTVPTVPSVGAAPTAPALPGGVGGTPTTAFSEFSAKLAQMPTEAQPHTAKGPAGRRIINTTHASIDYRIDTVGPSGVGKVEVYMSHDEGKSWRRVAEDIDRTTPAEVDLPGEGLFGIRLAITNGNGFGGTPPTAGAQPHVWVEVDTTPPFVQLRPIEIVPQAGAIDIRWSASDPNLAPEPVTLYYRTRPDAPWQPIAKHIKNDGSHRWSFPHDAGSQFLFKVEVVDLAGNVARAESQTPVVLDMTEPRASVISVTGMNKGN